MQEKYDLSVLLNGTNTEEQNNETIKIIEGLINKFEGKIIDSEEPLKRRLAYVIKKVRNGVYHSFHFEVDTKKISDLNKEFLLAPEILRFQILKFIPVKKVTKKPRIKPTETKEEKTEDASTEQSTAPEAKKEKIKDKKIDMEDLNKKLDAIIDTDSIN
ncbi:MAG: 30S ribosomal protein S6 [Patescibacteria group bacterium]